MQRHRALSLAESWSVWRRAARSTLLTQQHCSPTERQVSLGDPGAQSLRSSRVGARAGAVASRTLRGLTLNPEPCNWAAATAWYVGPSAGAASPSGLSGALATKCSWTCHLAAERAPLAAALGGQGVPLGWCLMMAGRWQPGAGPSCPLRLAGGARQVATLQEVKQAESAQLATAGAAEGVPHPGMEKLVLYRGRWMRLLRLVVRMKVIQLTGVAALALPIAQITQQGALTAGTLLAVGAVVGGAAAASAALWYYSSRYVGELSLLPPDHRRVQISTLDFWGARQNLDVELSDVVPPLRGLSDAELAAAAGHVLLPLEVVGARQFVLSLRHGHTLDRERLMALLHGRPIRGALAPAGQGDKG